MSKALIKLWFYSHPILGSIINIAILAVAILIAILVIRVICSYHAKLIAKEIRRNNGELARLIAHELRNMVEEGTE